MKKHYILLLVLFVSTLDLQAQLQYAICFDGINDFAPVYRSGKTNIFGDNSDQDSFTIEFWTKETSASGEYLYSKHNDNGSLKEGFFIKKSATGSITAGIANTSNTWSTVDGTTLVNDGNWHHIAFTYDYATNIIQLFLDGVLQDSEYGFTAVFGNTVDARLSSSQYENSYYGGSFDEVKIWNTARNATQINDHRYAEMDTNALPAELILYYQCNEGLPDTDNWILYQLVDHTGNGNPGDLWNVFRLGTCSNWVHSVPAATLSTETFEATIEGLSLYPNPAKDHVRINGLKANEDYAIFNTLGAVVKRGTVANNEEIAIANLKAGMYFLKLSGNRTIKFIKQ